MPSIKDLRLRIKSLKNTNKITAAMKLVATSKLRKAQEQAKANHPYAAKILEVLQRVASANARHPLFQERPVRRARVIVFSSDKGLCGSFNNQLLKFLTVQVGDLIGGQFDTWTVGRKATEYVSRRPALNFRQSLGGFAKAVDFGSIDALMSQCLEEFQRGEIDAVYLAFNRYESVLKQTPSLQRVLPVVRPEAQALDRKGNVQVAPEYILEPSAEEVMNSLVPRYLSSQFYQALLETQVGEFSARMTAMDAATKNSKDMINKKTLQMNRLRQAAITTELTEIVSGAESLKG
jgi:F-type H+-transporting ATPase subunit gamma